MLGRGFRILLIDRVGGIAVGDIGIIKDNGGPMPLIESPDDKHATDEDIKNRRLKHLGNTHEVASI